MGSQGVFRDDFYNAGAVLAQSQIQTTTQNGGVLNASAIAGAADSYLGLSGQTTAQALTTDTAANIIAQLQQAVAVAYKAAINSFGAGVNPPAGVPNLFNLTYTLTLINNNTASGAITLTGGTGVTIVGTNTLAVATIRVFVVTITSPTTVTLTNVGSGTN
jgi:hypothetical protein